MDYGSPDPHHQRIYRYGLPLGQQADIRSPGKPEYLCFLACVRPRPGRLAVVVGTSDAEHGGRPVLTELPYIQPLADVSRSQVSGCSTQSHVGTLRFQGRHCRFQHAFECMKAHASTSPPQTAPTGTFLIGKLMGNSVTQLALERPLLGMAEMPSHVSSTLRISKLLVADFITRLSRPLECSISGCLCLQCTASHSFSWLRMLWHSLQRDPCPNPSIPHNRWRTPNSHRHGTSTARPMTSARGSRGLAHLLHTAWPSKRPWEPERGVPGRVAILKSSQPAKVTCQPRL
jgi:hypothetical protein